MKATKIGAALSLAVVLASTHARADGSAEALTEAGARAVRLGDEVLRSSSAGPAALAVLNTRLGRWG